MLTEFISGLALVAVGGFLVLLAVPGHRSRRYRRHGEPRGRELRRRVRYVMAIVVIGAGMLIGAFGFVVLIVSLAGFEVGLV